MCGKLGQKLRFVEKDTGAIYWGTELWLPKSKVPVESIKASLTFDVGDDRICVWKETDKHIITPRELFSPENLQNFHCPIFDVRQREYDVVHFQDRFLPRSQVQEDAWKVLSKAGCGVVNIACGGGKTGLALKKAAQQRGPTLVVINNTGTGKQWMEEANKFLGLGKDEIGLVKGSIFDWKKPLVIATIQTLSKRAEQWPDEFLRRWKTIIFDEVHHTSARVFSKVLPLFHGIRIGLTATLHREDGLEDIFLYHVGPVIFSDLSQELPAKIYFQQTPFYCSMTDPNILDIRGEFNIGKFYAYLGRMEDRNSFLVEHISRALFNGRKILGFTHSREHTELLHKVIEESGVIHGGIKAGDRLRILRECRAVFATPGCAEEAMDDPALDTIMFFTPYQVWRTFQQGIGRSQRRFGDKKEPMVVLFEDIRIPPSRGLYNQLRGHLRKFGYDFSTVKI